MKNFLVTSDPNNKNPFTSTNIIVNSLNEAAKQLEIAGLDCVVHYDCLGDDQRTKPDALICVFELTFPRLILDRLAGRPTLGVSRDNLRFILDGGYRPELAGWFPLGVDSNKYKYVYKGGGSKFRFLAYSESNSRSGLEDVILAFGAAFKNTTSVELYIKDRNASPEFKEWVYRFAGAHNANIILDDKETTNYQEILDLAATADAAISLNHSSTWDMKALEVLSMGIPTISNAYSGHREYIVDGFSGLEVSYSLEKVTDEVIERKKKIGLKNYLLPEAYYHVSPTWSKWNVGSLVECMWKMRDSSKLRQKLSIGGRTMAESLTWEKSALALSQSLEKWF
jgi:glycosyltransferase involved in cell wall biosynthesis